MQQLSGLDASFLYFETANAPMHVGWFLVYDPSTAPDGFVRFKDILRHVESRLQLSRAFRQKLVNVPLNLDHPYWINDAEFDVEFHIRHIALPFPGDWRQLCILTARLHSRPLDPTKPLWEMYVIEGLDNVEGVPPGGFAVLIKIHHAIIDGVSGSEITEYIHDTEPNPGVARAAESWQPEQPPSVVELLMRTYGNNLIQPFRFMQVLGQSIPALARVTEGLRRETLKAAGPVPRSRFNRTITPHRVVDGRSFPLDDVRAIKSAVPDATVNDVILALVGGSLRKYLESKNDLPDTSLIAMAPISVREESQKGTAGNQVSAMVVALGTHIADPLERLRAVHEGAVNSKALTSAIGARTLTDYSQFIPSALAGLAARLYTSTGLANRIRPQFNTVVTNVPGPQTPLYFAGAKAVTMIGMGPIFDGMALIHPVFSYCGQIAVSFTSCREVMPDPEFYAECLQASYDELEDVATGGARPAKAAPKRQSTRQQDQASVAAPGVKAGGDPTTAS